MKGQDFDAIQAQPLAPTGYSPDCCKSVLRHEFRPAKIDRKPPSGQAHKAQTNAHTLHVSNLGCTHPNRPLPQG